MKYYLHDTNAFNDEKVTELFMEFGYEGLGLFYTILEKLAQQEKPVKTEVLKTQLRVGKRLNKCWKFMEEIGIIASNNGETFNKQLLNFSEKYQIKKEKNRERIAKWREKQDDVTCYENVRNSPKVKESKVKESKYNTSEHSSQVNKIFDIFYNSVNPTINYGNKTSRKACEWMIDKWGYETVERVAKYACEIHGQQYAPTISTPYQLKDKISNLKAHKDKQENNLSKIRSL